MKHLALGLALTIPLALGGSLCAPDAADAAEAADGPCEDAAPDNLIVTPARPLAYATIEHDPLDVEQTIKVRVHDSVTFKSGTLVVRALSLPRKVSGIEFPSSETLEPKKDSNIAIKATDVAWPGRSRVRLCLEAKLQEPETTIRRGVDLVFDVRTRPKVAALQTELELNLVKCFGRIGCWLAEAVVPNLTTLGDWPIELRNDSLKKMEITPQARIRRNEKEAPWPAFTMRNGGTLKTGATDSYLLSIDRAKLRPGSYEGNLVFAASPTGERPLPGKDANRGITRNRTETLVPITVNVRAGILWPLVLILLGILAGRVHRQISAPEAAARLELMNRMFALNSDIEQIRDRDRNAYWKNRQREIHLDLNRRRVANETIESQLTRLENQLRLIARLEALKIPDNNATIVDLVASARELIRNNELEDAEAKRQEILVELAKLEKEAKKANPLASFAPTREQLEDLEGPLVEAKNQQDPEKEGPGPWSFANVVGLITGTRDASTEVQYRYLQPLTSLVLLLALVAWGLFTFYSGPEHSTFGQALVDDYFPLFLWGFGSDVVSKSLGDFAFTR